ncbi:hypothetical protein R3P38DRAFT_2809096 [Favolaschia claudopus]|uniref:Uncharacterized protein n=1 Tax=Favolaschia claudopus TaxID=2862362 RepID=A0AAV9ZDV3_9AGAR
MSDSAYVRADFKTGIWNVMAMGTNRRAEVSLSRSSIPLKPSVSTSSSIASRCRVREVPFKPVDWKPIPLRGQLGLPFQYSLKLRRRRLFWKRILIIRIKEPREVCMEALAGFRQTGSVPRASVEVQSSKIRAVDALESFNPGDPTPRDDIVKIGEFVQFDTSSVGNVREEYPSQGQAGWFWSKLGKPGGLRKKRSVWQCRLRIDVVDGQAPNALNRRVTDWLSKYRLQKIVVRSGVVSGHDKFEDVRRSDIAQLGLPCGDRDRQSHADLPGSIKQLLGEAVSNVLHCLQTCVSVRRGCPRRDPVGNAKLVGGEI